MRGPGRAKIERVTGAWRRAKAGSFDARLDVTGIPCVQHCTTGSPASHSAIVSLLGAGGDPCCQVGVPTSGGRGWQRCVFEEGAKGGALCRD